MAATAAPATAPAASAAVARTERRGWLAVGAIAAVVAATWAPQLTAPLGDNHAGRITGRYALHLRNLREEGLVGSSFGADWAPYASGPYAHHPPLRNLLDALLGSVPGTGEYQLRIAPFMLALLAIPAAAALLRGLGIRWLPTLLAVGLMVVTGYYWIYGQVRYDLGVILVLAALIVHLRQRRDPPRWMVTATCVAALLATLQSWPGIVFAAALGLWLYTGRRRRLDRVTVAVGACMVVGVLASLAYMVGIHGLGALAGQAEVRAGGGFTLRQFVTRQLRYAVELLPVWYLVLLPVAVAAGLWDRRTRLATAVAAVFAAGWVLVLNNGAFVHDYWGFLVLLPGLLGMAALLDRVTRPATSETAGRRPARPAITAVATALAGVLLAAGLAGMVFGETGQRYVYRPADAGRLVVTNPPADGQSYAWYVRLGAPRWLAYYWQLPPRALTPELLADQAGPDDLVLIRLDRLPSWWPEHPAEPVAQQGSYALFRAADLYPD